MELFFQDDETSTSIDAHKKVIFELHKVCCQKRVQMISTRERGEEGPGAPLALACTPQKTFWMQLLPRFHRLYSEYNVIISFLVVIDIYD